MLISSSCRALVGHGFCVIVDASHNSLSESAVATKREKVLTVEPMPRELLEGLVGLGDLIGALRAAELDDAVWAVVSGQPRGLLQTRRLMGRRGAWRRDNCRITAVVVLFVSDLLRKAIEASDATITADDRPSPLFDLFTSTDAVPLSILAAMKLVRPSPDKVLRKAMPSMDALKAMAVERQGSLVA